jgi:hypothetical protein
LVFPVELGLAPAALGSSLLLELVFEVAGSAVAPFFSSSEEVAPTPLAETLERP